MVEPAASKKLATHRWWGSIPFIGETQISDNPDNVSPAHISADPLRARVSNLGAKLMGIPSGYKLANGLCGIAILNINPLRGLWKYLKE